MSRLVRLSRHPNPATLLTLDKQPRLAFTRCSLPILTREPTTRYFQCHRSCESAMLTNVVPTDCHTVRSEYAHYAVPRVDWLVSNYIFSLSWIIPSRLIRIPFRHSLIVLSNSNSIVIQIVRMYSVSAEGEGWNSHDSIEMPIRESCVWGEIGFVAI